MTAFVYNGATWFTRYILLPPYGKVEVRGLENLPLSGPLVIASNHLNDADPGVLSTRLPRRLAYMTKAELFRIPGLSHFLRAFGAFPVRRNEADISALRQAQEALKKGRALVIFPEGTRSGEKAALKEAWPGAALVALRGDFPVLPVAITGSQHMGLPKMFLKPFRRAQITLTIGKPFHLLQPERINGESARAATQVIMEHIAALLPEEYRGYYGETGNGEAELQPSPKVNDEDSQS